MLAEKIVNVKASQADILPTHDYIMISADHVSSLLFSTNLKSARKQCKSLINRNLRGKYWGISK